MENLYNYAVVLDGLIGLCVLLVLKYLFLPFEYVIYKYTGDSEKEWLAKFETLLFSGLMATVKVTSYLLVMIALIYPSVADVASINFRDKGILTENNKEYYVDGNKINYQFLLDDSVNDYLSKEVEYNLRTKTIYIPIEKQNNEKKETEEKETNEDLHGEQLGGLNVPSN